MVILLLLLFPIPKTLPKGVKKNVPERVEDARNMAKNQLVPERDICVRLHNLLTELGLFEVSSSKNSAQKL